MGLGSVRREQGRRFQREHRKKDVHKGRRVGDLNAERLWKSFGERFG